MFSSTSVVVDTSVLSSNNILVTNDPIAAAVVTAAAEVAVDSSILQLNEIRKALPTSVFKKSLWKSLAYMFFDYTMLGIRSYIYIYIYMFL